jgi:hypothetical protein
MWDVDIRDCYLNNHAVATEGVVDMWLNQWNQSLRGLNLYKRPYLPIYVGEPTNTKQLELIGTLIYII